MSRERVHRQELTPIHFLERAGEVYAGRTAVVDGESRFTFREMRARARRLASALQRDGLRKGERVAFLAFNSEPLLVAHFGVPLKWATRSEEHTSELQSPYVISSAV